MYYYQFVGNIIIKFIFIIYKGGKGIGLHDILNQAILISLGIGLYQV